MEELKTCLIIIYHMRTSARRLILFADYSMKGKQILSTASHNVIALLI